MLTVRCGIFERTAICHQCLVVASVDRPDLASRKRPYRLHLLLSLVALSLLTAASRVHAQGASLGEQAYKRLQSGVDNPEQEDNKYRVGLGSQQPGEVKSLEDVIKNMKVLAKPIWKKDPDREMDKWYSPHLRDAQFEQNLRDEQRKYRAEAGVAAETTCPFFGKFTLCVNGRGGYSHACDLPKCNQCWLNNLRKWPHPQHKTRACCLPTSRPGTGAYHSLNQDHNFKTCCVRDGTEGSLREVNWTEEQIACTHPLGDGWAGLFEYYYPTTIFGLEKQRGETMLATKQEVEKCLDESNKIMEEDESQAGVQNAIEKIRDSVPGGATGTPKPNAEQELKQKIKEDASTVRPKDQKLRFADSIQGEGLTARPFLPAYDRGEMRELAQRFCMHPKQFNKLMHPTFDKLQRGGGTSPQQLAENIPIWANYCKEGVELMRDTENSSRLINIDQTDTDFIAGMRAWDQDPLYCQRMNLKNPNMDKVGIGDAIRKSGGSPLRPVDVGYTCLNEKGSLNGSMVPVSLYRHAAVSRRTAIADHVLGFLIAGGIAPDMRTGPKSYYKRFEPQPYSMRAFTGYQAFWGKQHRPPDGETNERGLECKSLEGKNYQERDNSDQLFLSDYTHTSFTKEPILNTNGNRTAFDKYSQEWAKQNDEQAEKNIRRSGLDKDAHNYGVAFRIFATCPAGFSRWRPDASHGNLVVNLQRHCGEENFGSPIPH